MPARLLPALCLAFAALTASAQPMQPDAPPAEATLRLAAPDEGSATFDVRAVAASGMPACPGHIDPAAPDVVVEWAGGDLQVWVRAEFDATLMVSGPDGAWRCNDDAEGTSPVVSWDGAPAGRYAVWLGSFYPRPSHPTATLYAGTPPPPPTLDLEAAPLAGTVTASGGFENARGPIEVGVQAGGPARADALNLVTADGVPCVGFVNADRPTAAIDYSAAGGTGALAVSAAAASSDLVLLVRAPDGTVRCNDDFQGTDPLVEIASAESGTYLVWVGIFNVQGERASATLTLSESLPLDLDVEEVFVEDFDGGLPYSEGTYTLLAPSAQPAAQVTLRALAVSTPVTLRPSMRNPVEGPACGGFLEPAPTLGLQIERGGTVVVSASSTLDLVLLLRTPSGAWYCSDDAVDLNPGIQLDTPEAGEYLIWVGAYADGDESVGATVTVERATLDEVTRAY